MGVSSAVLLKVMIGAALGTAALTFFPWVARFPSDLLTLEGNRGPTADLALASAVAAAVLSLVALRTRDHGLMLPSLVSALAITALAAAVMDLNADFGHPLGLCGFAGCIPDGSLTEQPLQRVDGTPTVFAWSAVALSGLAALAGGLLMSRRLNERMDLRNTEVIESWA